MTIQIFILIFGFALLIVGADLLVKGASNIAKNFHVPEIIIGLTIVSLGTTLPELVVSLVSASTSSTDLILGNVIGSNLCNLLLILGVIVILKPIKFEKETIVKELPLLLLLNIFVFLLGLGVFSKTKMTINWNNGIILLIAALIYFLVPVLNFFKNNKNDEKISYKTKEKNKKYLIKNMIYILLGAIALKFGGDFAVDSATSIAKIFNISERVIGLTIVAIGTSLPELITSIIAIITGNDDIAEGNIIGACIINSSLVLGASSMISNIPLNATHIEDLMLLIICIGLIWLFGKINKENTLKRSNGLILFSIYAIYLIKLFI